MCYTEWCYKQRIEDTDLDQHYCYDCAVDMFGMTDMDEPAATQRVAPAATQPAAPAATQLAAPAAQEPKVACPKCASLVLVSLHAMHVELCAGVSPAAEAAKQPAAAAAKQLAANVVSNVLRRTETPTSARSEPFSADLPVQSARCDASVPQMTPMPMPLPGVQQQSGEVPALLSPAVGSRWVLNGRPGLVWNEKKTKAAGSPTFIGFAFDDAAPAQPWVSLELARFRATATPWLGHDDDASACRAVLTEVQAGVGGILLKMPAALLYGQISLQSPRDLWEAFSAYKPLVSISPTASMTSPPPVTFSFKQCELVMCTPPFIAATKGSNTAPTPMEAIPGRMLGVMLGSEWNASKSKAEYRRWVVAQLASSTSSRGWQACLLPLVQVGAWPEGRSTEMADAGLPLLSACECNTLLGEAAMAKKPGSYNSHLCTARKQRKAQLELSKSQLVPERTRGQRGPVLAGTPARTPAIARAPTASARAPASSPAAAGGTALPRSGIKQGLDGIGEKKINEFSEEQLLLALEEHGLPAPYATEPDKSLYAKRLLFQKYARPSTSLAFASVCMYSSTD